MKTHALTTHISRSFYYPPESGSIMIFAKIFAAIHQATDKSAILYKFSQVLILI
jgi:hypothetical protein